MSIKDTYSVVRVLYDSIVRGKTDFASIAHLPAKTKLLSYDKDPFFPSASARAAGMDGERLLRFIETVSADKTADIHSLVVLSHGKCVFEAAKAGYDTTLPHATFSLCKTLTGIAIGMLIDDGRLSLTDPVLSFFPEHSAKHKSGKHKLLTVAHLLEMSSGITFNETGVITSESYTNGYFESPIRGTPGKEFSYNSMNSYILSAIVTRVSGQPLSEFLKHRLFAPLGITNYFWESSTEGIEKGGWGLYLSVRSMAKLGQLFLDRGRVGGREIVSAKWLAEMGKPHMKVSDSIGAFHYGYHMWCHKEDGTLLLNGMLGQNVWIDPDASLVVAATAGDNCLFQDAVALMSAMRLLRGGKPADTLATRNRRRYLARHFGEDGSFIPPYISPEGKEAAAALLPRITGKFTLAQNNSGVLPLLTRMIQNSPTKGIEAIELRKADGYKEGTITVSFKEGGHTYCIWAGYADFLLGTLDIHGEKYRVGAAYTLGLDAERAPFFKLEIRFSEMASTRRLIIRPTEEGLLLTLSEQPGYPLIERFTKDVRIEGNELLNLLTKSKMPVEWALKHTRRAFSPAVTLTPVPPHEGKEGGKAP